MALSMNCIALVGTLTDPVRSRMTSQGRVATRIPLAVDRTFSRGTKGRPDYFAVIAWQDRAEIAAEILTEDCVGLPVSVYGEIHQRELPAKEPCGCKRTIYEVHAAHVGLPTAWMRERNRRRRGGVLEND